MKRLVLLLSLVLPMMLGAQQWEIVREDASVLTGGIINDKYEAVLIGHELNVDGTCFGLIAKVGTDGSYETHGFDDELDGIQLKKIVQLYNGNYIVTGNTANYDKVVAVLDENLDIIKVNQHQPEGAFKFGEYQDIIYDNGSVIMQVSAWDDEVWNGGTSLKPAFLVFDENAELLNSVYPEPNDGVYGNPHASIFGDCHFKKIPDGSGYVLIAERTLQSTRIFIYDNDLNYKENHIIWHPELDSGREVFLYSHDGVDSELWVSDDEMFFFGGHTNHDFEDESYTKYEVILSIVKLNGTVSRHSVILGTDKCHLAASGYNCMSYVNDSTIYGSYYSFNRMGIDPFIPGICLFTRDMEVLGTYVYDEETYGLMSPGWILSYDNGDCLYVNNQLVMKLSRADFNPSYVGVKDVPAEEIESLVYPNPTDGKLNIDIRGIDTDSENRVRIIDMNGRTLMSRIIRGRGNVLTMDVGAFDAGVYVYEIFNAEGTLSRGRFVKK